MVARSPDGSGVSAADHEKIVGVLSAVQIRFVASLLHLEEVNTEEGSRMSLPTREEVVEFEFDWKRSQTGSQWQWRELNFVMAAVMVVVVVVVAAAAAVVWLAWRLELEHK